MATQFKVEIDGKTEVYTVKPKHILKAERGGGVEATAESSYMLAWYAAGSPLGSMEEWLETVDDITPIVPEDAEEAKTDEIPPTTAGSRRSRS